MFLGIRRKPNQRKRGIWPCRQTWFSVCSMHRRYDASCKMCTSGMWLSDINNFVSNRIYKRWPDLWRRWANSKAKLKWLDALVGKK